jgi:hypothetical protein
MNESKYVKIVFTTPESHADIIKEAMGNAGAGKIGNYSFCFFTVKGIGQFKPEEGAKPFIGKINKIELVNEERIETVCERDCLEKVIEAIKRVHPYEEIALDVYQLEDIGMNIKR